MAGGVTESHAFVGAASKHAGPIPDRILSVWLDLYSADVGLPVILQYGRYDKLDHCMKLEFVDTPLVNGR